MGNIQIEETEEQKYYRRKDEIMSKLQTDYNRYMSDILFRSVLEVMIKDEEPYKIIMKLLNINLENIERFRKILEQWPSREGPLL